MLKVLTSRVAMIGALCLVMLAVSQPMTYGVDDDHKAGDDAKLTAIGGLSAGYVYNSYIAIGAIGDGFGKGVYTDEQVQELTNDIVNMMDVVKKQTLGIQQYVSKADQDFVDDVFEILGLLQEQARQLKKYSETENASDLTAYEKARTKVWPKIQKLLGLNK